MPDVAGSIFAVQARRPVPPGWPGSDYPEVTGAEARSDETLRAHRGRETGVDQDRDEFRRLLAATAASDRRAFQDLYKLTSARLFAVALRVLRDRALAEDVLQEAYLTIWNKAGDYHSDRGEALAWMASIVRNRCIDKLRQLRRQSEGSDRLRAEAPEPTWEAQLRERESSLAAGMRDCLAQLQENHRKALLLAYYEGLTHEELAETLGVPLGTAKSWVRRGLMQLKNHFEAQESLA